jgi:hypothetical protein
LQVFWLQVPAWGRQSTSVAQAVPSTLQVWVRHCASELQNFPDCAHSPCAVPPRQLTPSSQSTPTSVEVSNAPPGTPVSEPEVSSTTSMFGWWICREMINSGSTRASAGPAVAAPSASKATATLANEAPKPPR